MFINMPSVLHAPDSGQVAGQRTFTLGGSLKFGKSYKDSLRFRGRQIVYDALAPQVDK
jgi:hypothetical protein